MENKNIFQIFYASDRGKVRWENEDNFYIDGAGIRNISESSAAGQLIRKPPFICAVFDGMGGEECGQKASREAARYLMDYSRRLADSRSVTERLEETAEGMDWEVRMMLADEEARSGGTTCAGLVFQDLRLARFWIGDSRIYCLREGTLSLLTKDHTAAQREIDKGRMTEEEARRSRMWHMLLRFLGMGRPKMIETEISEIQEGDIFLLCSDGLTDMCSGEEIKKILEESKDGEERQPAKALIQAALDNGGRDNVTAIVIEVHEDGGDDKKEDQ